MIWTDRAAANLLPLSVEKTCLPVALKEWVYEGTVTDYEIPSETCQLCGHQDLRYQFEIVNRLTRNTLQIGSECIKRFSIQVLDARGGVLLGREAGRKVDADRREMELQARTRRVLNALVAVAVADEDFDLENFIAYYQRREAFTPKQMFLLQWRFSRNGIEHRPADFKVSLRQGREQEQLRGMEAWKVEKIGAYLSGEQRNSSFIRRPA